MNKISNEKLISSIEKLTESSVRTLAKRMIQESAQNQSYNLSKINASIAQQSGMNIKIDMNKSFKAAVESDRVQDISFKVQNDELQADPMLKSSKPNTLKQGENRNQRFNASVDTKHMHNSTQINNEPCLFPIPQVDPINHQIKDENLNLYMTQKQLVLSFNNLSKHADP